MRNRILRVPAPLKVNREPAAPGRRQNSRGRRLAATVAAGLALIMAVPEQALADPAPSPGSAQPSAPDVAPPRKNGHQNTAMIDGASGPVDATAGVAADGGSVTPRKQPTGKPFTQKQLAERSRARAIAENQQSFTESSTLDQPGTASRAAASGIDLPTSPLESDQDDCLNSTGADSDHGRVYNRSLYCLKSDTTVHYWKIDNKGVPVEEVGTTTISFLMMAYGSRQSRSIRVFFKTVERSADYEWDWDEQAKAPLQHLMVDVRCVSNVVADTRCVLGGHATSKTFSAWNDGSDWVSWDITSTKPSLEESGTDHLWLHNWEVTFQSGLEDEFRTVVPGHTASRAIRCDSAAYFKSPKQPEACIFNDVIPHLEYSTADKGPKPSDGVAEVAEHIRAAQNNPNGTYPLVSPARDKKIPGKYTGSRDDPPLRRIAKSDVQYEQNGDHKTAACYGTGTPELRDKYFGLGLPTRPDTSHQDCDEYPFAITREGAANPIWDFSVRAVNNRQNRRAGQRLGQYFGHDRILLDNNDGFYVNITDTPVDNPGNDRIVDAGPDVTGTEGSMIHLAGAADAAEEGSVRWSVTAVSGTDAGATCAFGDVEAPDTYLTCQDDGVFEVTLASDDGIDAAWSDSATVTVEDNPAVGPDLLPVTVTNNTGHGEDVFLYILGQDIRPGGRLGYVDASGRFTNWPAGGLPPTPAPDVSIAGPADGGSLTVRFPRFISARIYFSIGQRLDFRLTPDGLVQPAPWAAGDPNRDILFDWSEFTYNDAGLWLNSSQVDMFALPHAVAVTGADGRTTRTGDPVAGGRQNVIDQIRGTGDFNRSIVTRSDGTVLRVLAPGKAMDAGLMSPTYLDSYITSAWNAYTTSPLTVVPRVNEPDRRFFGRTSGNTMVFTDASGAQVATVAKPTTANAWGCDGVFDAPNAPPFIEPEIKRTLCTALNRGTLGTSTQEPVLDAGQFYRNSAPNHYSRIIHANMADGRAYGFAYDDVAGLESLVHSGNPRSAQIVLSPVTGGSR